MKDLLFRLRSVRGIYRVGRIAASGLGHYFHRGLFRLGFVLVPSTTAIEIETLFDAMRPVDVGVPLVRVGGWVDGGYLLPEDLDGISSLISPGVGHSSSFEEYFAKQGVTCHLIDASVDAPPTWHENFTFSRLFVGPRTEGELVSLGALLRQQPDADAVLQMDVEGAEWDVLDATSSQALSTFRIMVVEFHDLGRRLAQRSTYAATLRLVHRLKETFDVVHFHPNNYGKYFSYSGRDLPNVVELTFLRKDRARAPARVAAVPHPLDRENAGTGREPAKIPAWWI